MEIRSPSAIVMQHKIQHQVQFEITQATRDALQVWIKRAGLKQEDFIFPSRLHDSPHLGTRQYAWILGYWVDELGLYRADYGTDSMRRTKATLIYRRTKNLRAVQLLMGHSKFESTVRYLGIEVDDALEISEQTELSRGGGTAAPVRAPRRRNSTGCCPAPSLAHTLSQKQPLAFDCFQVAGRPRFFVLEHEPTRLQSLHRGRRTNASNCFCYGFKRSSPCRPRTRRQQAALAALSPLPTRPPHRTDVVKPACGLPSMRRCA